MASNWAQRQQEAAYRGQVSCSGEAALVLAQADVDRLIAAAKLLIDSGELLKAQDVISSASAAVSARNAQLIRQILRG
ncbi:hypothetical protein ACIGO9_28550 [Nocardia asteroides]|uniref:hypothetical protein n=1 Tax=Nocardia asteroides TaxID=1824 RepID=UPI0037CA2F8A